MPSTTQRRSGQPTPWNGPVGHGPWWLHRSTALLAQLSGADELALQETARAAAAAQDEDRAIELFARLSIDGFRSGSQGWRPFVDEDAIEAAQAHSSRMLRHVSFVWLTDRARRDEAFDDMLSAAREATDHGVEGAGFWFASLQQQAIALLKLGRLEEALHLADVDLDWAHQYGDRSAMLVPIGVYAAVLKELDEAPAAATLRGWIPPRLTVMLSDEITDLDHWLSDRLPSDQLDDLKARGRLMTPHELQALGQDAAAIHLRDDP